MIKVRDSLRNVNPVVTSQSPTNPVLTPQIFCVSTENVGFRMFLCEVVTVSCSFRSRLRCRGAKSVSQKGSLVAHFLGVEGVPGSNPGGPIIFRGKIEGRQSNTAGGERGLGQGWVCGGQYPGGPMN